MGYAVIHLEKAKGTDIAMSAHIERKIHPDNADATRTFLNRELIQYPEGVRDRTQAIVHRLETAGIKRKIGKNQVSILRVLLTGSHEDMKDIELNGRIDEWCRDNIEWLKATFGDVNVVSAVLHMDEKTPHIHATITPVVIGERRKAAKEQTIEGKRKYRKKSCLTARLCADDIMTRTKLKNYQDSYPRAMAKYGLRRGIDGSLAKHMSSSQYYKDLMNKQESIQSNIEELLSEQKDVHLRLKDAKNEFHKQELKNAVTNTTAAIASGVGSLFGAGKLKEIEKNNEQLKQQIKTDQANIRKMVNVIENQKRIHSEEIRQKNDEHQQEKALLQNRINEIDTYFPNVSLLIPVAHQCREIGLNESQTRNVVNFVPIQYTGKLYYKQERKSIEANNVTVSVSQDNTENTHFHLCVNGIHLLKWFKERLKILRNMIQKLRNANREYRGLKR